MKSRYFGPRPWGFAVEEPDLMLAAAPPLLCLRCNELVEPWDSGIVMDAMMDTESWAAVAYHRECHLRTIFGSVAHQQGTCTCAGGTEEDDPALTTRQAAKASVDYFEAMRRQHVRERADGVR